MQHMVPSWFIPPVGIIVADVACPSPEWFNFAQVLLTIGIVSYAVMLPVMIYRFMFYAQVPDAANEKTNDSGEGNHKRRTSGV